MDHRQTQPARRSSHPEPFFQVLLATSAIAAALLVTMAITPPQRASANEAPSTPVDEPALMGP